MASWRRSSVTVPRTVRRLRSSSVTTLPTGNRCLGKRVSIGCSDIVVEERRRQAVFDVVCLAAGLLAPAARPAQTPCYTSRFAPPQPVSGRRQPCSMMGWTPPGLRCAKQDGASAGSVAPGAETTHGGITPVILGGRQRPGHGRTSFRVQFARGLPRTTADDSCWHHTGRYAVSLRTATRSTAGASATRAGRSVTVCSERDGRQQTSPLWIRCASRIVSHPSLGRPRDHSSGSGRRVLGTDPRGPANLTEPGLSDPQVLQILDRGPHLASVPRRPVVAFRQPLNTRAAAHGDQLDHQMLRAVVLAQGQKPLRQSDRGKLAHTRTS